MAEASGRLSTSADDSKNRWNLQRNIDNGMKPRRRHGNLHGFRRRQSPPNDDENPQESSQRLERRIMVRSRDYLGLSFPEKGSVGFDNVAKLPNEEKHILVTTAQDHVLVRRCRSTSTRRHNCSHYPDEQHGGADFRGQICHSPHSREGHQGDPLGIHAQSGY
eukprot:4410353-Amphidinium_carterae.1